MQKIALFVKTKGLLFRQNATKLVRKLNSTSAFKQSDNVTDYKEKFKLLYPQILEKLDKTDDIDIFIKGHITNIVEHNVLKRNNYIVFPITLAYSSIVSPEEQTKENFYIANVLDWCIELLLTSHSMMRNLMNFSTIQQQQKFPNVMETNSKYLMDAKLLEVLGYNLLQNHCSCKPYYKYLLELTHYTCRMNSLGDSLNLSERYLPFNEGKNLQQYTMEMFERVAERRTYYFGNRYTIYAAMYLSNNCNYQNKHTEMDNMLKRLAHIEQAQNNIQNFYTNKSERKNDYNDIMEGKFTWLIAMSLQCVNPQQLKLLQDNYGKKNLDNYKIVCEIYKEIDLYKKYLTYKEKVLEEIKKSVKNISDPPIREVLYQCLHLFEISDTNVI